MSQRSWTFALVVLIMVVAAGSLFAADGATSAKDKHADKVKFGAFVNMMHADIKLPAGADFAEGFGEEPNSPSGEIYIFGGQASVPVAKKTRVLLGLGFPTFDSTYRQGFSENKRWTPPGWGEAYTYATLVGMDPVPSLKLVFGEESLVNERGDVQDSLTYGIGLERIGVKIEQGHDWWNRRDALREIKGTGTGYMVFANWNFDQTSIGLEAMQVSGLGFGQYGDGKMTSFSINVVMNF